MPETPGQTDDFGSGSTGGGDSSAPPTVDLTPPGSSPPGSPPSDPPGGGSDSGGSAPPSSPPSGPPSGSPTRPRRPREDDEDELEELLSEPILEPSTKRTPTDIDRLGAIREIEIGVGIGGGGSDSGPADQFDSLDEFTGNN